MNGICGDNRFEIIAKVKEHLIEATNIEMCPEELAHVDSILFRLWQLDYFNQSKLEKENAELKAACVCEDKEQLTRAKEIIKGLLIIYSASGMIDRIIIEAEQFLKEVEK